MKCPFGDLGVVTRAVPVLGICADVLRGVTVLAPVEPWSLGYELASPGFLESHASQTCRSRAITRPICAPAYHAISSVAPRFVHESVHNTLRRRLFSAAHGIIRYSWFTRRSPARIRPACKPDSVIWAFVDSSYVGCPTNPLVKALALLATESCC